MEAKLATEQRTFQHFRKDKLLSPQIVSYGTRKDSMFALGYQASDSRLTQLDY